GRKGESLRTAERGPGNRGRVRGGHGRKYRYACLRAQQSALPSLYSAGVANVSDYFAPGSPLGDHLPAFQPRPGQAAMAEAVADALERRGRLVVEAGT